MKWKLQRHGIYYLLDVKDGTVSYHGIHKYEIESDTPGLYYYGETKGFITNDIFEGVTFEKTSASQVTRDVYEDWNEKVSGLPEIGRQRLVRCLPVTVGISP